MTSLPPNLTSQEFDMMLIPSPSLRHLSRHFALVPQSDISEMNTSDYNHFNVVEPSNYTESVYYNNVPVGSYSLVEPKNAFIAFTIKQAVPPNIAGYMGFSGSAETFAGFVLIMVSLFLRRKDPPIDF